MMKKINYNVAILMAAFLSARAFCAAPVNDLTASTNNQQIEKQLQELSHLLTTRNRMQVRLQSQLDELAQEMNQIQGNIELFNHKIGQIENRQRNLYQLIDQQNNPQVANAEDGKRASDTVAPPAEAEKIAYQKAVDLVLVNKEYAQAVSAFEAFVNAYPKSPYVANSQYWLGQLLYKQKKREQARAAFLIVTEQFPDSSKRPDALFKIGIIDEYLDNIASAEEFYKKVLAEYPDSSASVLAAKRLSGL